VLKPSWFGCSPLHPTLRVLCAAGVTVVTALTSARAQTIPAKATDDELQIRGIFDSALPGTEQKNSLRLIVHPHMGDFHRSDYLRMPVGVRYGASDRIEVTGEVETFASHGLGHVPVFRKYGFSALHLGSKMQLGDLLHNGWATAVGFDWTRPVGQPPADITDGLIHIAPYVSLSHRLVSASDWRVFGALAYDEVRGTHLPMTLRKNQLGADAPTISGGVLHERGPMTYTLEMLWTSSRVSRRFDHDVFTVRPGLVWVVPKRFTFGSDGRWVVGTGLRLSDGPDGFDVGVSMKLRANFNFRRLFKRAEKSGP